MAEIDHKQLIRAVKKQPVIWNKHHPSYKDRNYTKKAWTAVCKELNGEIEKLDQWEIHGYGEE